MIEFSDVDIQHKFLRDKLLSSFKNTLKSNQFIGGKNISEFEKKFSNLLNIKYCLGVANGTDALQIALMALDLKPGDEVIVPGFTYVATAEVIGLLGLIPIMVDVDIENFNISISNLEELITPKTKAIVPGNYSSRHHYPYSVNEIDGKKSKKGSKEIYFLFFRCLNHEKKQ